MPPFTLGTRTQQLIAKIDSLILKGTNNPELVAELQEIRLQIEAAEHARNVRKLANLLLHAAHWLTKYYE